MGICRCGKSTLLKIYVDYLKSLGVLPKQIIFINFEDMDNLAIFSLFFLN
jgi:predicted AAA+ superfamily ATPase